ncbi:unnamed protein product [Toxocara canis]|uniref:Vacuolar protein sorting-associated protein 51 homolog n=1 Tax=Toxocara canis TaxID=6265 RepID=A0A183UXU6_TOXCA|nr:unnamed protein product [Toxocara canis]
MAQSAGMHCVNLQSLSIAIKAPLYGVIQDLCRHIFEALQKFRDTPTLMTDSRNCSRDFFDELSNSDKILSESEFVEMVSEAVKRVLGQAGPNYELGSFDGNTRKGSLVVSAADSHLVWAALSIYGRHFGAPVALHLNSVCVY